MSRAVVNEHDHHFGPNEWTLSASLAVIWGSSFLWIAIAIDHVASPVVPLARCLFGFVALLCFPSARRAIDRSDLALFAVTGLVWMAVPFLLYPVAERTVSTSVTGMLNGGLPVITTVITAVFTRTVPSRRRMVAVTIGAVGIAMISLSSVGDRKGASTFGVVLLLLALICYAVAVNIARPLQVKYGAMPTMMWLTLFGTMWSVPFGVAAIADSSFTWAAVASLVVLGAIGTGIAFAVYGALLQRAGPVRGMIGIFFTPVVGLLLGVTIRDDQLHVWALVGMGVVFVGAVLTSRPDHAGPNHSGPNHSGPTTATVAVDPGQF